MPKIVASVAHRFLTGEIMVRTCKVPAEDKRKRDFYYSGHKKDLDEIDRLIRLGIEADVKERGND